MDIRLNNLNKTIVNCKKCPRLVKFVHKVSTIKRKKNIKEIYWGKPVPGFGNLDSKLAIIGLAPAAHGGTRTGRAFTGDKSGDFLFKCCMKLNFKFPLSKNLNDNLKLKSTHNKYFEMALQKINHLSTKYQTVLTFLMRKFYL